jgi:hypothetical protein
VNSAELLGTFGTIWHKFAQQSSAATMHRIVMDIEVQKKPDGTFDIFKNGKLLSGSVPTLALVEKQLDPYGVVGGTYRELQRQLAETGMAKVSTLGEGPLRRAG